MRLLLLFLGLAILVLLSFFIWGDSLMEMFSERGSIDFLKGYGGWAWLVAILLLTADLLLPLPATLVIAALGYLYGPVVGGLVGAAGSFTSGMVGYWACRMLGEKTALRLLGERDYHRGRNLSGSIGGWVVVLSRWLPVFPEVVACMAGLTRMPAPYFHVALLCGSVPLGFVYAFVGHTGTEHPVLSIGLSAGLPPLIWWIIRPLFKKRFSI
jgi:uncharacterized membrane protein YdjX (TVP38/TMEM64 family)